MSPSRIRVKVFVCLFLLLGLYDQVFANDLEIAKKYYLKASALDVKDNSKQIAAYLEQALEFAPDYSDALFMFYRLNQNEIDKTNEALEWLNRAIELDNWVFQNKWEAQYEKAKLLLRTKKYSESLSLFLTVENFYKDHPEFYHNLAILYRQTRNNNKLETLLLAMVKRFPLDVFFYDYLIWFYVGENRLNEARNFLGRALAQLPDNGVMRLWEARLETDASVKSELAESLVKKFLSVPGVYLLALEVLPESAEDWAKAFVDKGRHLSINLFKEFLSLYTPDFQSPWLQTLKEFSGVRRYDSNEDGFFEEQWLYEDGELINWSRDFNQNGFPEIRVGFKSGLPQDVELYSDDLLIQQIKYLDYPYVQDIRYWEKDESIEYHLLPKALAFEITGDSSRFKLEPDLLQDKMVKFVEPLSVEGIKPFVFEARVYSKHQESDQAKRYIQYEGGIPVIEKWHLDRNDSYDKIVYYQKGLALRGVIDYDGDGEFESSEIYSQGILKEISHDLDGDGLFEWRSFYDSQGKMLEQRWDVTADGIEDYIEIIADNLKKYRFSTQFDGVFDLEINVRAGDIIEMRRNGLVLPIIPSKRPDVFWISQVGLEPLDGFSAGIGRYQRAKRYFFYFKLGNSVYIEEIK